MAYSGPIMHDFYEKRVNVLLIYFTINGEKEVNNYKI